MGHFEQGTFVSRLVSAGYEPSNAAARAAVLSRAGALLDILNAGNHSRTISFLVPGRIEFLGKHTDYAGGRSLLCAVERGFGIIAVPRNDRIVRIADPFGGNPIEFQIDPELNITDTGWPNYAMTVARRLVRNFPEPLLGADIAFASDLPPSAGMSSSSALMIAIYLVLAKINRLEDCPIYRQNILTREDLAGYLGTVENGQSYRELPGDRGVGTFGGSQDHTAILCARPGVLRQYSFCPVRAERDVALPAGYILAVGSSGVIAEKTGAARDAYNGVALSVTAILNLWRQQTGRTDATLADAIHSDIGAADALRAMVAKSAVDGASPHRLIDRLNQFLAESEEIIPSAAAAMEAGRLTELGSLVDRSQDLARRLLRNQVPETIFLARAPREAGAVAASAFGAGFGGSVWALVRSGDSERFLRAWRENYQRQFPETVQQSTFFLTRAGNAACEVV